MKNRINKFIISFGVLILFFPYYQIILWKTLIACEGFCGERVLRIGFMPSVIYRIMTKNYGSGFDSLSIAWVWILVEITVIYLIVGLIFSMINSHNKKNKKL